MKQLKNEVTVITGAGSGTGKVKALRFASEDPKVTALDAGEANRYGVMDETGKSKREAIFIKANPPKPEEYEAIVTAPSKLSFIDATGTVILVGVILTIIILFFFFGNGINIAKPILR